jgi:hypothetical protein
MSIFLLLILTGGRQAGKQTNKQTKQYLLQGNKEKSVLAFVRSD